MVNPLRDLLGPKTVVGLEITDHHICAGQVSNPHSAPEVEHVFIKEIESAGHVHEALEAVFSEEKFEKETVVTALPSSLATIREIPLPFDKPKKLRKIIKYQMESYVPYAIEDMVVDFVPSESGERIITAGVQKKALSEHLELLSQFSVSPKVVSLKNMALFNLFAHSRKGDSEKPVSIIYLARGRMVVMVICENQVDFIRTVKGGPGQLDALKESLGLYHLKRTRETIQEILLTGPSAADEGLAEEISEITHVHASLWQPFNDFKLRRGKVEKEMQSNLSVALGLALSMENGSTPAFNLRKEEFAVETVADIKPMVLFMILTFFLLVGLFTFNLYQQLNHQENYYSALNQSIRKVFADTFPQTKQIIRGRELEQFRDKVTTEKGQYQWLDAFYTDSSILDVLLVITKVVSRYPDMNIEHLGADGKGIHMDGATTSFKTVDRLKGELSDTGSFENIKLVGAKMDKKRNAIQFNFVLERKS